MGIYRRENILEADATQEKFTGNTNKSRLISVLDALYRREISHPNSPCFVQPTGNGDLIHFSWGEVAQQARRLAGYLRSLNLESESRISIMSGNCAYWIIADLAIWLAGHISVPIYPVLNGRSVRQILDHSESQVLFAGKLEDWEDIRTGVPSDVHIVTFPLNSSVPPQAGKCWEEIQSDYEPIHDSPRPDLEDLATIIYTSGTTGTPKGVMHSFKNLAIVGSASGDMYDISDKDRKLSYLPLAHVGERASVEINQIYYGYTVYFSWSLETFAEDLKRARPTLFFAVPRIWQKFQQQVHTKIPSRKLNLLLRLPIIKRYIVKKLLSGLGLDQTRVAISGSAPLSTQLINWYRNIGIELLEGYGMTENFAFSHASRAGQSRIGYVGTPSIGVECKLSPKGEILIKTPAATVGYYKEPDLTQELFDPDGYIRTGDIGEIDSKGRLKITGRVKEIFKTSKGKYVAPAHIEDQLLKNDAIEQVCVTGANLPQPIALTTLSNSSKLTPVAGKGKAVLNESLLSTLRETNSRLDKHEKLSKLVIIEDEWSIETDLITPTLKIKRAKIEQKYNQFFDNWVAREDDVIWAKSTIP